MAKAQRILDIQSYSGEADTPYRGASGSFSEGENIEVRKNMTGFYLSPLLEDIGWIFDDDIIKMVDLETLGVSGGGTIVCLDNGKIFLDGVLKETLNTGTNSYDKVFGIGVNNIQGTNYVYYITGSVFGVFKIHRSTADLSSFNINYLEGQYSSGNPNFVGIINDTGLLYIAVKNKVYILDSDEIFEEYLDLPENESIKGFTQYLGNFRIYTNVVNTGVQYIWNGIDEAVTTRQEWENLPILGVVNNGSIDYATLGYNENYSDLYIIQGTQKEQVRANLEGKVGGRTFSGKMSIRDGMIYISGGRENKGIYTYGKYYPGKNKGLVQSYSLAGANFLDHTHSETHSYFACADKKVYRIEHNTPASKNALRGHIKTLIYEGGVWEELGLDKIKLAHETNGGSIKIYIRVDEDESFQLIKEIADTENKKTYITVNEVINNGVNLKPHSEIQFMIELIRGTGEQNNPIVKRFTAWSDILNNS